MYTEIEISNWNHLLQIFYKLNNFIFRGQSSSEWKLQSSIERISKFADNIEVAEGKIIKKFKQNARLYLDHTPDEDDIFEWLSYIQHYGGPTRLVDFSYSPYIACFFALDDILDHRDSGAAIYGVNKAILWQAIAVKNNFEYPYNWFWVGYKTNEIFNNLKFTTNDNSILFLERKTNHERTSIQQGVFLVSLNRNASFHDELFRFFNIKESDKNENITPETSIIKIKINYSSAINMMKELHKMNINSETLFPGLEGFTKSLKWKAICDAW